MKPLHRTIQLALFVVTVALPVLALAQAGAEATGAAEVVKTPSWWQGALAKAALQVLPMLMGTITPWVVSGIKNAVGPMASKLPPWALKFLNVVLGALLASIASATGDVDAGIAAAEGATFSGVAWKLKEAEPTMAKPAVAKTEEQASA